MTEFRRRKHGKGRQVGSLFRVRQYQRYSEMVHVDMPSNAELSVARLEREFMGAKKQSKQLRILRIIKQSENIAGVMVRNPRLGEAQREEARAVAEIYSKAYNKLRPRYFERWT